VDLSQCELWSWLAYPTVRIRFRNLREIRKMGGLDATWASQLKSEGLQWICILARLLLRLQQRICPLFQKEQCSWAKSIAHSATKIAQTRGRADKTSRSKSRWSVSVTCAPQLARMLAASLAWWATMTDTKGPFPMPAEHRSQGPTRVRPILRRGSLNSRPATDTELLPCPGWAIRAILVADSCGAEGVH